MDILNVASAFPSIAASAEMNGAPPGLSADSLLAYCQMQLGSLDGQISVLMTTQTQAANEREAFNNVNTVMQQYGTKGPQSQADMQTCVAAFDTAIANLGPNDPATSRLASIRDAMVSAYQYTPSTLSEKEQTTLTNAQAAVSGGAGDLVDPDSSPSATYQDEVDTLGPRTGTFQGVDQDSGNVETWQMRMDDLSGVSDSVKSSAEVELLKLQDLVSQRQQAVSLTTSMMTKVDQSLQDEAKAVGQ